LKAGLIDKEGLRRRIVLAFGIKSEWRLKLGKVMVDEHQNKKSRGIFQEQLGFKLETLAFDNVDHR